MKQRAEEGAGTPFTTVYAQCRNHSCGRISHQSEQRQGERGTEIHGIAGRDCDLSGQRQGERNISEVVQ